MEKFWAVILIFVVVAAAGLMYVNQVYNPQKDTQAAMADMVAQTLSAVELEIGDGNYTFVVKGSEIEDWINGKLAEHGVSSGDVDITINGKTYSDNIDNMVASGKISAEKDYAIQIKKGSDGKIQIIIKTKTTA